MNFIKWHLEELKELKMFKHKINYFKYLFSNKYRNTLFTIWYEFPKIYAIHNGFKFSKETPPQDLKEIFIYNIYDIKNFIPEENDYVIDIGASYGDTSILWSVRNKAIIFAFEQDTKRYKILLDNIELNKEYNKSKIIPINISVNNINSLDTYEFKKVNLLKIDVEGDEYKVLQGAINTIQKHKPKIIIETHSKKLHYDCNTFLENLGYKLIYSKDKRKTKKMNEVINLFYEYDGIYQ